MKKISDKLSSVYNGRALTRTGMTQDELSLWRKWLRYYLDFCAKYQHPPRDSDSLQLFMQKLSAKNQTGDQQAQASKAIGLFYEVVEELGLSEHSPDDPVRIREEAWTACFDQMKNIIKTKQYSPSTLKTYRNWNEQFRTFIDSKNPSELDSEDAQRFLTHLAVKRKVAASTQNQAFNSLLFFYRYVLKKEYEMQGKVTRAKQTKYIPVVLSRDEVDTIIGHMKGAPQLATQLLFGCGLRLFECLSLRVHCFNLDARILTIHDGKGKKDRTVPLPHILIPSLKIHLEKVIALHKEDLAEGYDGVFMPNAMDRARKNAAKELVWQWFFPAKSLTFVPEENEHRRYHMHDTQYGKALRKAVQKASLTKRVTAHTFRHTFASHLLQANYDIRTIQQMLGHADVKTTMIYTHTVPSKTLKEQRSPLDF